MDGNSSATCAPRCTEKSAALSSRIFHDNASALLKYFSFERREIPFQQNLRKKGTKSIATDPLFRSGGFILISNSFFLQQPPQCIRPLCCQRFAPDAVRMDQSGWHPPSQEG